MGKHFKNESGLEFKDISGEEARVYMYPGGAAVTILSPRKLHVSASGGHRVFDAAGNSWYIPSDWIAIRWNVKPGEAHFTF